MSSLNFQLSILTSMSHDFTTRSIHAGRTAESSAVPIYQGINAPLNDGVEYVSAVGGVGGPTIESMEQLVSDLEGAAWSIATPSGMAAIAHVLFGLLQTGDRVVAHRCIYSYASRLLNGDLTDKWGVTVEWVDMRDLDQLEKALGKPTKLVYFDPVANPAMHLLDTAAITNRAKQAGAIVVTDNTLLSPYLLKPLDLGVDIVLHSATKYLAGHGDALAGVISGRDFDLGATFTKMRTFLGGFLAPMNAFLVIRGIRTLPFRMERHCANTQTILEWLKTRSEVSSIRYAGWADNAPSSNLPAFGGMLAFTVQAGIDLKKFRYGLKLCRPWGSLGDIETLVALPAADELRDIPPRLVRMAVGLEEPRDIIADLQQALEAAKIG